MRVRQGLRRRCSLHRPLRHRPLRRHRAQAERARPRARRPRREQRRLLLHARVRLLALRLGRTPAADPPILPWTTDPGALQDFGTSPGPREVHAPAPSPGASSPFQERISSTCDRSPPGGRAHRLQVNPIPSRAFVEPPGRGRGGRDLGELTFGKRWGLSVFASATTCTSNSLRSTAPS